MDISVYRGPQAFGKAYRQMLENDVHAVGSVDRQIVADMVRLTAETVHHLYCSYTSVSRGYATGSRPVLEHVLSDILPADASSDQTLETIARYTSMLAEKAVSDIEDMQFGGREEEIIERGSDWCTDVARVGCALYQVAGYPSRIVNLFDINAAYSGHVIVEVYCDRAWGAIDTSSGVVYRKPDGSLATTWELMCSAELVNSHAGSTAWYTRPEQFTAAGIANYFLGDAGKYSYTVSGLNDYVRGILQMSNKGWPGGLRWLYGEDRP